MAANVDQLLRRYRIELICLEDMDRNIKAIQNSDSDQRIIKSELECEYHVRAKCRMRFQGAFKNLLIARKALIEDLIDVDLVEQLRKKGFDGEFQVRQANPQFEEISWALSELGIEPQIV